jgi:hypothetical protein
VALLKLINPQGIVGLAVAAILTALLIAAKVDVRHWKGQSATFEQLYRAEAKAHAGTIANYRVAAEKARAADAANAERVKAEADKIYTMLSRNASLMLALALAACSKADRPEPIKAVAEQRQCPIIPAPPPALIKPPVKVDFLTPTG